jgi:hypothetical protein
MVTAVGMQTELINATQDLLELDYDAIEAYDAAINRLENQLYKDKMAEFKADHLRHVRELTAFLEDNEEEAPEGPSGKQWLTKGKVIIANLLGDNAILAAMRSNEVDTNTAYERMTQRDDLVPELVLIIKRGFEDEKRHKAWLEATLQA